MTDDRDREEEEDRDDEDEDRDRRPRDLDGDGVGKSRFNVLVSGNRPMRDINTADTFLPSKRPFSQHAPLRRLRQAPHALRRHRI